MAPLDDCLRGDTPTRCQAVSYAYLIGSPVLLLLGTVGNVWIAFVVTRFGLRKSPTAALILALAVMDTLALWVGLGRHFTLYSTGIDLRKIAPAACKIQRFLLYFAMDASSTILTAICADRFFAIWLPHQRKVFTLNRARLVVVGLTLASVFFNLHIFWTRGEFVAYNSKKNRTETEVCGYPKPQYKAYWDTYQGWVALAYFCLIPFAAMTVLNSLVVFKMRAQRLLLASARARDDFRLTVMLLSTSLIFLCITAPASIYNTVEATFDQATKTRLKVVDAYSTMLQYLNHAINFYLYILTGRGFRRDVRSSLRMAASRRLPPATSGESSQDCQTTSTT